MAKPRNVAAGKAEGPAPIPPIVGAEQSPEALAAVAAGAPKVEPPLPDDGTKPEPPPASAPVSETIVPLTDISFGWHGVLVQLRKDVPMPLEPAQVALLETMGSPFTRRT